MQRNQPMSGAVVRAARVLAGMTQSQLAAAAGVHPKTVGYWERLGSRRWSSEVGLRRIADALRARGVEIIRGEGEGVRRIGAI